MFLTSEKWFEAPSVDYPVFAANDLPCFYEEDTAVFMARDPWWAFAYWEITPGKRKQTEEEHGLKFDEGQVVFRVYEVTAPLSGRGATGSLMSPCQGTVSFFCDVQVGRFCGDWYFEFNAPGRTFFAEVGYLTQSGRFIVLVRSNQIRLPRPEMFPHSEGEWSYASGEIAKEALHGTK